MRVDNSAVLLVLIYLAKLSLSAPVDHGKEENPDPSFNIDVEYKNYLEEVARLLENDEDFINQIKDVTHSKDFQPEDISFALKFANHNVRTKLDELKRIEMNRLREYAARQARLNNPDRKAFQLPSHLDIRNPHTFEEEDLKRLFKAVANDIEELSKKRKEEFKKYEMEKEHNYRESLKKLNETERKEAEKKHEEIIKKHKDHPKVHHPGSKPQLEQVWEEEDELPKDEFNPETFFSMHDLNDDGFLDEDEVEAILTPEVNKVYERNNEEDDPVERREELARMSEHIFKETDKNNDYLISKEEFIKMTKRDEFERDEGWKGLDEELPYTDEELAEYEKMIAQKKKETLENKV